jgi:uncharacterized protein YbaA (DUF1428 family)
MYRVLYIFRVPTQHVEAFMRIDAEAAAIYRRYGALEAELMRATGTDAKHGCTGLTHVIQPAPDELIFLSVSGFRDAAHHAEVLAKVDADPRINELYQRICQIADVSRVLRAEFESVQQ